LFHACVLSSFNHCVVLFSLFRLHFEVPQQSSTNHQNSPYNKQLPRPIQLSHPQLHHSFEKTAKQITSGHKMCQYTRVQYEHCLHLSLYRRIESYCEYQIARKEGEPGRRSLSGERRRPRQLCEAGQTERFVITSRKCGICAEEEASERKALKEDGKRGQGESRASVGGYESGKRVTIRGALQQGAVADEMVQDVPWDMTRATDTSLICDPEIFKKEEWEGEAVVRSAQEESEKQRRLVKEERVTQVRGRTASQRGGRNGRGESATGSSSYKRKSRKLENSAEGATRKGGNT
jgi:hypothetical protein